jgi:hypothetical protein
VEGAGAGVNVVGCDNKPAAASAAAKSASVTISVAANSVAAPGGADGGGWKGLNPTVGQLTGLAAQAPPKKHGFDRAFNGLSRLYPPKC